MKQEVVVTLIERIAEALEEEGTVNISFQGGEPTSAGLSYFQTFVDLLAQYPTIQANYSLQTNGIQIDEAWCTFFKKHHFLIGMSLDGYETITNQYRIDQNGNGVFNSVLAAIALLEKFDVPYNILTVLTKSLAEHPKALFAFYQAHHFQFIQLIPCLPFLNEKENAMSLTPRLYESFYLSFFQAFLSDLKKGGQMSINLFDQIAGMLQGYAPYQCGMLGNCQIQYIVEANGDVYPCDFYCTDSYCLGNISAHTFAQLAKTNVAKKFIQEGSCQKEICQTCPYQKICHGGCRRQNVCYLENDYCAHQRVLDVLVPSLLALFR